MCEQCLVGYLITLKRSSSTLPTRSWHFQTHPSIKIWRSKQLHLFSAAGLHLSMSTDHKIMDCKLSAKSLSRNVDKYSITKDQYINVNLINIYFSYFIFLHFRRKIHREQDRHDLLTIKQKHQCPKYKDIIATNHVCHGNSLLKLYRCFAFSSFLTATMYKRTRGAAT